MSTARRWPVRLWRTVFPGPPVVSAGMALALLPVPLFAAIPITWGILLGLGIHPLPPVWVSWAPDIFGWKSVSNPSVPITPPPRPGLPLPLFAIVVSWVCASALAFIGGAVVLVHAWLSAGVGEHQWRKRLGSVAFPVAIYILFVIGALTSTRPVAAIILLNPCFGGLCWWVSWLVIYSERKRQIEQARAAMVVDGSAPEDTP